MAGTQLQMAPLQIQGAQNDIAQQGLNLDQLRLALQAQQARTDMAIQNARGQGYNLGGQGAPPAGSAGAGAENAASSSGGIQNGPQGSVSAPMTGPTQASGSFNGSYDQSNPLAYFMDPRRIAGNAALGQFNATLTGGDPNKPIADALKLQSDARDAAIKNAQIMAEIPAPGNSMPVLKAIASMSPEQAAETLKANPQLMAPWAQAAKKWGADPFDKTHIPVVAALAYNEKGAPIGLSVDVPHPMKTVQQGLGQSYQVDTVTGKISGGASAVPTEKYIVNGQVREMPKAQGVASGATPYDPSLYGASLITPQASEQAYQQAKATGTMPALAGRDPIAYAQESNYIAQRAAQEGVTGLSMAARQQTYKAQQGVVDDFTSGKTAGIINGINTAVQHINLLGPLVDAMGTGNTAVINRARNAWEQATGSPAPTNYAAIKEFVGGETAKAVLPGGGGEGERAALLDPLKAANSPTQLHEAMGEIQGALAGKTESLRNQWNVGTQGTQGSFDKFLMPETRAALSGHGAPGSGANSGPGGNIPMTNARGWQLHQDKNGNMAYVSPDGKQFQEAR
jgi:hypothetical protein